MTSTRQHFLNDPKKSPAIIRWGVFVCSWTVIGVIWLALLPRHSESEDSQAQWEKWRARGIDPSATYYSELERHKQILSQWRERKATTPESVSTPVPTSREE